jgi:hypothetical protein
MKQKTEINNNFISEEGKRAFIKGLKNTQENIEKDSLAKKEAKTMDIKTKSYLAGIFDGEEELKKIFEEELIGKTTNAGRIYRKLKARDNKFIQRFQEDIKLMKPPIYKKDVLRLLENYTGDLGK